MAEYLYPDIKTFDRCLGTAAVSEVVLEEIGPVFSYEWHEVLFMNTETFSKEVAEKIDLSIIPQSWPTEWKCRLILSEIR